MTGYWSYKESERHKCSLPVYEKANKYDRWFCQECGVEWIVTKINHDQKDGDWLSFENYETWKYGPFAPGTK